MKITDLTVEVRDKNLKRLGQLMPEDLVGFHAVLRKNEIGTWSCQLPVGHRLAEMLVQPGSGVIVSFGSTTLLSGPAISVNTTQSIDDYSGTYTITGVDDSVILKERLAYPVPSTDDMNLQIAAYDERTGLAEDLIKQYVDANIGSLAPASRKISKLVVEPSQGRGTSVSGSGRFQTIQELISGLAEVSDLGYTIEQVDDELHFIVYQPIDRSASVRLDLQNGRLKQSEYAFSQPKATRIIVGGNGSGTTRDFSEQSNSTSLTAESDWGRRIEVFHDGGGQEASQAAAEVLATDGKTVVSVNISPSDDTTMLYGVDWNLGDKLTVVVGNTELVSVVTEVGLMVADDGVRIAATIGEPKMLDYETQIITQQLAQSSRISQLERK